MLRIRCDLSVPIVVDTLAQVLKEEEGPSSQRVSDQQLHHFETDFEAVYCPLHTASEKLQLAREVGLSRNQGMVPWVVDYVSVSRHGNIVDRSTFAAMRVS